MKLASYLDTKYNWVKKAFLEEFNDVDIVLEERPSEDYIYLYVKDKKTNRNYQQRIDGLNFRQSKDPDDYLIHAFKGIGEGLAQFRRNDGRDPKTGDKIFHSGGMVSGIPSWGAVPPIRSKYTIEEETNKALTKGELDELYKKSIMTAAKVEQIQRDYSGIKNYGRY